MSGSTSISSADLFGDSSDLKGKNTEHHGGSLSMYANVRPELTPFSKSVFLALFQLDL